MSLFSILTLIFIVLKLTDYIDWSWWLVVTPSIIQFVLFISVFTLAVYAEGKRDKRFDSWRR